MPAFVIRVEGELSEPLLSWFPSMTAQAQNGYTLLSGDLPDQTSLLGVLAALDMMGVRIVVAGLATELADVASSN